uniref:Uncharacterized protein n=1 Tax=Aegilops tauschii subsp. strangulata TaxID=200361 RepID=A0A453BY15_AEGTS
PSPLIKCWHALAPRLPLSSPSSSSQPHLLLLFLSPPKTESPKRQRQNHATARIFVP